MNCPYCNTKMQKGYVQCRDGVYWNSKKQWVAALASLGREATPLYDEEQNGPKSEAIAYNCRRCKTVIIPYGRAE